MSHREGTIEQLDPLAGLNGRTVTIAGSITVVLVAIVMTVFNREDVDEWWAAILAIAVIAVAATLLLIASSPLRPPLHRSRFIVIITLGLVAMTLSAWSMHTSNGYIQDDWGTIAVGGLLLLGCPYRPPRELLVITVLATVFAGFVVLVQTPALRTQLPVFVYVVIAVTPLLCLALAGVGFAAVVLKMLRRWQRRANEAVQSFADAQRAGITRSVQQDRVTILNRDVVPFFSDVLLRSELTDADRERAGAIAAQIRTLMVAEVDRTWLDVVVEQASNRTIPADAVRDPERTASGMSTDQRTAMRAMLVAVIRHPGFDATGFSISLASDGDRARGVLRASFAAHVQRTAFAPYLAVLRAVFLDLQVEQTPASLTVRFSYARH